MPRIICAFRAAKEIGIFYDIWKIAQQFSCLDSLEDAWAIRNLDTGYRCQLARELKLWAELQKREWADDVGNISAASPWLTDFFLAKFTAVLLTTLDLTRMIKLAMTES